MANDAPCSPLSRSQLECPCSRETPASKREFLGARPVLGRPGHLVFCTFLLEAKIDGKGEKMPLILGSTGESLKLVLWIAESARAV